MRLISSGLMTFVNYLTKTLEGKFKNLTVTFTTGNEIKHLPKNEHSYSLFTIHANEEEGRRKELTFFLVDLKEHNANRIQVCALSQRSINALAELKGKIDKTFFFNTTGWDSEKGAASIYNHGKEREPMTWVWGVYLLTEPLIVDGMKIDQVVNMVANEFEKQDVQLLLKDNVIHLEGIDRRLKKYKHLLHSPNFTSRLSIEELGSKRWFGALYLFTVKTFIDAYQAFVEGSNDITQARAFSVVLLNKLYKEMEEDYFNAIERLTLKYGVCRTQRPDTSIQWVR